VERTVLDVLGGVRSTCTYVGAAALKELPRHTTFIRVTQQLNEVFNPFHVNEKSAANDPATATGGGFSLRCCSLANDASLRPRVDSSTGRKQRSFVVPDIHSLDKSCCRIVISRAYEVETILVVSQIS